MTTSWTQADVDALEAAIKTGAIEVQYENRRVRYNSTTEMLKLLQTMKDTVAKATESPRSRTSYGSFSKSRRRTLGDE